MPFKMHKIIFSPEKNFKKNNVCLPYLKFSDPLPKTYFFIWPQLTVENQMECGLNSFDLN